MKREKRDEIVKIAVDEQQRLKLQSQKKEEELRRQYEEVRKCFEEEKTKVFHISSFYYTASTGYRPTLVQIIFSWLMVDNVF